MYLVSNHIKDNEPLKWDIRKESLSILACSRSLEENSVSDTPTDLAIDVVSSCAYSSISLLELSSISGLISSTNADLIIRELQTLMKSLKETYHDYTTKAGFVLSDEFFRTIDNGQQSGILSSVNQKSKNNQSQIDDNIKDKKDGRRNRIIDLLKTKSDLTIKDFARVIADCSEKTIQRELIDLVEKGIVKKEGERRWSKYSLK